MQVKHQVRQPTKRVKKILRNREPKQRENPKGSLFMYGSKISQDMKHLLKDLYLFKKTNSHQLTRKNPVLPFEDNTLFEKYSKKFDKSFVIFTNHSKKRPNNLIITRLFDYNVLDMIELGVENLKTAREFKNDKIPSDIKPCMVFCGNEFEHSTEWKKVKNMLIDFFRGYEMPHISVVGIKHVIFVTLDEGRLYFRSYRVDLIKSGVKVPKVELIEIGPSFTMVLRRTHMASEDHIRSATRVPIEQRRSNKRKNVEVNPLGTKLGRVHMMPQDLRAIQTRKRKALRMTKEEFQESKKRKSSERVELKEIN